MLVKVFSHFLCSVQFKDTCMNSADRNCIIIIRNQSLVDQLTGYQLGGPNLREEELYNG